MKPGEGSAFLEGLYWISIMPAMLVVFFVTSFGMVLLLPVQLVTWFLSDQSFFGTMPYVLLMALSFDDRDLAGPVPTALSPLYEELRLINSWYLDHPKFFRIFVLLRHYRQDDGGAVTVLPGLAPRRKLLRFCLGLPYLSLWCSPLLLLL